MIKPICLCLPLLLAVSAYAQLGQMTPAQAQEDFDVMRQALEEAHSGLYRYSTKPEIDGMFAAQRAKLDRPMNTAELWTILSETLAQIRCGHTGMDPDQTTSAAAATAKKFPLRVRVQGPDRLVVLFNDTADNQTIRPGAEILKINGRSAGDVLKRIWRTMSADGDIESGKRERMGNFALYYWLAIEQAAEFSIEFRDGSSTASVKLAGVTDAERTSHQNAVNAGIHSGLDQLNWFHDNLSIRFLKDPEIAQIRIRGFSGKDFPQWMEDTFKSLREKGTKTLIVDLRQNGGGVDMYGAMLVSYLTDKPFRYFDHINVRTIAPRFKGESDWNRSRETELSERMIRNPKVGFLVPASIHPGVAEQMPGKYPFLGKVFVLTDGRTFSTSADFCAVVHHLKRAIFIGEETGGGYYGNNSGMSTRVTLPHLKSRVGIQMYEYWNAVDGTGQKRRGTLPDHRVETKVADLLRGIDEPLNVALRLANQ